VSGGGVDLPHQLVFLAVERAPEVVGVVGVGLDGEMAHADHLAQIPGHGGGAGLQNHGQGCVPHRALGRHCLVGEQAEIAFDFLPGRRHLAGQQIARGTGGQGRGIFLRADLRLDHGGKDQKQQHGTGKA